MADDDAIQTDEYVAGLVAAPYYRRLVWFTALASVVSSALAGFRRGGPDNRVLVLILAVATMVAAMRSAHAAYRFAQHIGWNHAWLHGLGCLIPVVSLVVLAGISRDATVWFRARGFAVGLLGPTLKSRQQVMTLLSQRKRS